MSGHSHWSTIKHKKGAADARKSKVFSRLAREIMVAAKEGGSDINFNPKLRMTVDRAKEENMPTDNIERSIKKGTGEIEGAILEEVIFEAYGPGGTAIIIEGITDNKNRTLTEIKQILNQNNGKLTGEGAVRWMFEKKGVIVVKKPEDQSVIKEDLELTAIESGAEDISWHDDVLIIYTKPEELENIRRSLKNKKIHPESVSLDWLAKKNIAVEEKTKVACQKLFEALDKNDSVQEIYSNLKI